MNNIQILLSGAHGIYIPRDFVRDFVLDNWNIAGKDDAWAIEACNDPDNEQYWDAWVYILDNASCMDDGKVYTLFQDGDLFAIAYDDLDDDEYYNFFGEER